MIQWRRFQFFDKDLVREEGQTTPHQALQKLAVTCSTSGRGNLVLGDTEGFLNLVDRDFVVTSFQAYESSVTHVHHLRERNVLVSVGHDNDMLSTIKIWNLDKLDKNEVPLCLKSFRIEKFTCTVACIAVLEDLTQIAFGLANGAVVVVRGDIVRDKIPKQKVLREQAKEPAPVTGLGFRVTGKTIHLFVATPTNIISYWISNRDIENVLDEKGCELGCAVMSDEQDFIIGRNEAVYFYGPDGLGPCSGFEGTKIKLAWFRSYLIVVGLDSAATPTAAVANSPAAQMKYNSFNIYDIKNKFIAYTETKFENVTQVVSEWGCIFVFTSDGKVHQLEEKDTQTKLETLFKKNLYSVAINLALSQHYDYNSIIDIFRKYGDHLYGKGDYDGAISQYLKTIGRLEPSYVIRKFLDAQRIYNLTSYLQALHEKNLATADHTTLLLNCYTKLKDVKKLDQFIKTDSGLNFEVETAIKVLRQAGYHEHALYLAMKHNEHDWYLKILLEDMQDFQKAIDYIATLDFFEAEKNVKKYGKNLVTSLPEETTTLIMKLCTGYQASVKPEKSGHTPTPTPPTTVTAASLIPNVPSISSLGSLLSSSPQKGTHPEDTYQAEREALFSVSSRKAVTAHPPAAAPSVGHEDHVEGAKAEPEEFIHIFVNQPEWLTKFLEFVVSNGVGSTLVYNTLLELYMRDDKTEVDPEQRSKRISKALDLLTNPQAKFDEDHALVLAQVHNFRAGILYLYEKLKLYNEIIQYHMEHNEYDQINRACKKYGDKDPGLWVQALSYFASKEEDCQKEIIEVLANIDRDNLIPPLLVIQILAQKPTTTLSVIKDYITKRLLHENSAIQEDLRMIRSYSEETEKMKNEINELRTSAKIFRQSKCIVCQSAIDLPAVHFLCNHSFHQRCLGENERECPICTPGNRKILDIKRNLQENAGQHDQFFKQLENASDGFSVVAEKIGRGIFSPHSLIGASSAPEPTRPATGNPRLSMINR